MVSFLFTIKKQTSRKSWGNTWQQNKHQFCRKRQTNDKKMTTNKSDTKENDKKMTKKWQNNDKIIISTFSSPWLATYLINLVEISMVNEGKYTSPMDAMGSTIWVGQNSPIKIGDSKHCILLHLDFFSLFTWSLVILDTASNHAGALGMIIINLYSKWGTPR